MMMPAVAMVVRVDVVGISATIGLERGLHFRELRAEAVEHMLDHMVGPNAENLVPHFSRQMPVSEVPSQAHELVGISVPNFDNMLRSGLNHQPPAIFKLQTISISPRTPFRQLQKYIFGFLLT